MEHVFFLSLNEKEFKAFLREALTEILREGKVETADNMSQILTIAEAAVFLKLKVTTIYEKTSGRAIPHFKKGNRLYFYRAELEEWLREGKVKTQKELQSEAATFTMRRQRSK